MVRMLVSAVVSDVFRVHILDGDGKVGMQPTPPFGGTTPIMDGSWDLSAP